MRKLLTLAAAAPFMMLAACGDTTPVEETEIAPMEAEVAELDMASEALPEVPENALDVVAFSGTYVREGSGGTEQVRLDAENDTWEYTMPDDTVTRGTFTRLDDNQRLMIEDFDGEPAYFSVADGTIYRLDNAETPPDEITVTAQYRRDDRASAEPIAAPTGDAGEGAPRESGSTEVEAPGAAANTGAGNGANAGADPRP